MPEFLPSEADDRVFPELFEEEREDIDLDLAAPDEAKIEALAKQYRQAYDDAEIADKIAREKKLAKEQAAIDLYDAMIAEGLEKASVLGVGSIAPVLEQNCGIVKEHEEAIFQAFEELGLGSSIKRVIHFQTFNAHYRNKDFEVVDDAEYDRAVATNLDADIIPASWVKRWDRKKIRMRRSNV